MTKLHSAGLTLIQIILGCVLGLVGGLVAYYLLNSLIWEHFLANFIGNGLIASIFTLIFFLATYGTAVICTGEGVRFIESLKHKNLIPREEVYRGTFMGAPAIIGLLLIANIDLGSMGGIIFPLNIVFGIVYAIVYVLTIPIKIITTFIPTEVLYLIAMPVGAIVAFKIYKADKELERQEVKG